MEVKLQHLDAMTAAYVHADSEAPEENAMKSILGYAKDNRLTQEGGGRLFGRNTYPTDKPEPHGYEYYLTVDKNAKPKGEVAIRNLPSGLYAVLTTQSLFSLGEGWQSLFSWVKTSGYEAIGVTKGEHGWVNGAFEELVNWQEEKPPTEWVFNLWVQLKE